MTACHDGPIALRRTASRRTAQGGMHLGKRTQQHQKREMKMAKPTTEEIIAMLNEDIKGEHGAIIQYLRHAYAMGEIGVAFEIEAIAREEMYHLKWLSELVASLGGAPTIERAKVDLAGHEPSERMFRDTILEQEAIDLYLKHIAAIEDPKIVRLLQRIVADERSHKGDFTKFINEVPTATELAEGGAPAGDLQTAGLLNVGVRHEYTVVLQYLFHSFMTPDCDISRQLEFQAINEMQHMGWLAEKVEGQGAEPDTKHAEVDLSRDTAQMLRADISAERAVTMDYNMQIDQVQDAGIKTLLARIRDHEIYHDQLFSDILENLTGQSNGAPAAKTVAATGPTTSTKPPTAKPTVGSLMGQ
jgi:bacterioferritin